MFDTVRRVLLGGDEREFDGEVLYECRHCGAKYDDRPRSCHECENPGIAVYVLETRDDGSSADEREKGDTDVAVDREDASAR